MIFNDLLISKDGMIKGPFGSAVKKSLFVPKGRHTYKVYEQSVVANNDFSKGNYYLDGDYVESKLSRFLIEPGDILMTGAGTLGLLTEVPVGIEPGVMNQALIRIRLNEDVIYKPYFKYYFPWAIKDYASRINGNSVIPNLPPLSVLKEIEVKLPSMEMQKQVADKLDLIDKKIKLNNSIVYELEEMAKTIYDYWFLQFDFPDADGNGNPYRSSGGKMVWNDELKREIPEGWKIEQIKDNIIHIKTGLNPRQNFKLGNGNIKYITVKNILSDGIIDFEKCDVIDEKARQIVHKRSDIKKGDILYASISPLGRCYLIQNEPKDWDINESVFSIRTDRLKLSNLYLYMLLSSDYFTKMAESNTAGSVFKGIRIKTIESTPIVVPPLKIQNQFDESLESAFRLMDNKLQENVNLKSLRDFLLPLLMNGQVTVK